MKAITYENTCTNIPRWIGTIHEEYSRGYAYESGGYFFHLYGRNHGSWFLFTTLTASEAIKSESLDEWSKRVFGAKNSSSIYHNVGEVTWGVWRPGLYFFKDIIQALSIDDYERRLSEQALRVLIEKLDVILTYMEPSPSSLKTYGHKTRELLILASTEVENYWSHYMRATGFQSKGRPLTTNDYVKLLAPLHLMEYEITFRLYKDMPPVAPFISWSAANPTRSLAWYNSYNKTKHDREKNFSEATLENCMHAISAAIVMFSVRYSPLPLLEGNGTLSALFNQHFSISLKNPDITSFYVPLIVPDSHYNKDLICGDPKKYIQPWTQKPLTI